MGDGTKGNSTKRDNTAQRIITAIKDSNGLLTLAAKKAGVGYTTLWRYTQDYPTVKRAVTEAKESMIDFAESKLLTAIKEGNMTAIIFYLKTQAKHRGFTERQEITGGQGEPLVPRNMHLHLADGTEIKPPRNGHYPAEVTAGDNGHGE